MNLNVSPNSGESRDNLINGTTSDALDTGSGNYEKTELSYKTKPNRNGTLDVTKMISVNVEGETKIYILKIHNIQRESIPKFLGLQENKLIAIAMTQLGRGKEGSVHLTKTGDYQTRFKRAIPFTSFLGKTIKVDPNSKDQFFKPQLEKQQKKLELYKNIQKLSDKVKSGDSSGLSEKESELFGAMKNNEIISDLDSYKDLFENDLFYNDRLLKILEAKIKNLEQRIELTQTAIKIYNHLNNPKKQTESSASEGPLVT